MRITSTWLLTSAAQVILTIAIGAFMIINAAVIGFYAKDGYDNYSKKQAMHVVAEGRIHTFHSLEFTTTPLGTQRHCVALVPDHGNATVREYGDWQGNIPPGDFCQQLFNAGNLSLWNDFAPTSNGMSSVEKLLWSFGFLIVFISGAILITNIPANAIALMVPVLAPFVRLISVVLTLPVFLFWGVFVSSAWSYNPSYWKSRDGYIVNTEKVFIAADHKLYKAPETLFGWTDNHTMEERKVLDVSQ